MLMRFAPWTDEDVDAAQAADEVHEAMIFRYLHDAWFVRDARDKPLVPLNYEKLDTVVDVSRAFKGAREVFDNKNGSKSFRLKQSGADFEISGEGLDVLEQHIKVFVPAFLSASDAEVVQGVKGWIARARAGIAQQASRQANRAARRRKEKTKEPMP